jgi:hypothetical protein
MLRQFSLCILALKKTHPDLLFISSTASIKNRCWALSLIALQLLLLLPGVLAQPARLYVAYTGLGPTHLPVWIAKEIGVLLGKGGSRVSRSCQKTMGKEQQKNAKENI